MAKQFKWSIVFLFFFHAYMTSDIESFLFCLWDSTGLILFFVMESSLLHDQLYNSYSPLLCRDTQTSCCTINVSFYAPQFMST